jgi:ABC-2 type transport system permease protein
MRSRKITDIITLSIALAVIIVLNMLSSYVYEQWDWTEEKKYTLSSSTIHIIDSVQQPLYVRILLEGEFPAGFKRLQDATSDFLRDLEYRNGLIEVDFFNPVEGSTEEVNQRKQNLSEKGIVPVNFRLVQGEESVEKLIYPYAILSMGEEEAVVNLLEEQTPGLSDEVVLNNSISLLEYKFANAIHKLNRKFKPLIVFIQGHGELTNEQVADYRNQLDEYYRFATLTLDSSTFIPPSVELVIVARPKTAFTEKEKFVLDQYVMNGGHMLWLIDQLDVNLDSLRGKKQYIPTVRELNLDDMFFKYGFRINPDLVLDLECSSIPLQIGMSGGSPQFELFPWYYHPLIQPSQDHPVSRNMGRVNLLFPSSIDTLKTKYPTQKKVLLASSDYSMRQLIPMRLNFEILRYEPDPDMFSKSSFPTGVLLEGQFSSLYENRITAQMEQGLDQLDLKFKESGPQNGRMAIISDGDIIKNMINIENDQYRPVGFNPFDRRTYDNRDFIVNLTEYLINGATILGARNKEVKLRLLDRVQAKEEQTYWQFFNLAVPLIFLFIFGVGFNFWRQKKYSA